VNKKKSEIIAPNPIALIPLFCFFFLFIGSGLYFESKGVAYAFYQLSSVVAILPSIIIAIFLSKSEISVAISRFIDGISDNNIITMCLIFLLAGGFAEVAKSTGGVDATVAMGLHFIPSNYMLVGLFIITAFISTAMGTSMGTLAAVTPIALGIAQTADIDLALTAGVIVSGAIFGDNLSIISDTTIASTRTQGCEMKDKFKENIRFAIPSALITMLIFGIANESGTAIEPKDYNVIMVFPYLSILILAVAGLNVFVVLVVGILFASGIGMYEVNYTVLNMTSDIYKGFMNMHEIFLLSMLIGGLASLMRHQGGLSFLNVYVLRFIKYFSETSERIAQITAKLGIGFLGLLTNICIANNTIAILISGDIVKDLAKKHNIQPKQAASLIDIFTCIMQGLLPYGAQALLVSAAFEITPFSVASHAWYCMILLIISILFIISRNR
jgi:Na+/H+ antiporter NhaC